MKSLNIYGDVFCYRNSMVHPLISPDEEEGKITDEESDLEYDSSK